MELNILKREIVENGKPKFEMIFNGGKTTTVQEMKKSIGEKNVVKLIVLLLEDLVNYFNVQRPMTKFATKCTGAAARQDHHSRGR